MMQTIYLSLFLLFSLFQTSDILAQKVFSEGVIKYDVYVNNETKPGGVYVVSVKGGNVKRELSMHNGYTNITIFDSKSSRTWSYNPGDAHKYALELSTEELREKNAKFESARIVDMNTQKKIAGLDCRGYKVSYAKKEDAIFYASNELLAPSDNFNAMFPGFKGIPLEYEVNSAANMSFHFVATLVDAMAIDSKIFALPSDFKIVTKSELDKLK